MSPRFHLGRTRRPVQLTLAGLLAACHARRGPSTPARPPAAPSDGRSPVSSRPPPPDPVVLRDTHSLDVPDFLARQRVEAAYGGRHHGFEAVLQLSHGTLRLLGLTPFGTKAFLLEQEGTRVRFERFVEIDLPFAPERILFDVHRALFYQLPRSSAPVRRGRLGPFTVEERGPGGKVSERIFYGGDGRIRAHVHLAPPAEPGAVPETIRIEAPPYGYRLTIRTLEVRRLKPRP